MNINDIIKKRLQDRIDSNNQKRLKNKDITIISSNCTGSFLYHWLGLQFKSPFINLYMTPDDFIVAMEHFEEFMSYSVTEKIDVNLGYPVGIGAFNTLIHFMHYTTFEEAIEKWNERKKRINTENMCIFLSNWGGDRAVGAV
jgi:uncharacterized protein (DUF1919 family)